MFLSRPRLQSSLVPLVTGTALLAIPFHLRPENFIVDDGYFYPQIARYIVHHQGSTFNGIMLTNGYHPLWMLVCVAAAWFTTAAMPLLQILGTVQDFLLLACVVLLATLARETRMRGGLFGCLVLLFFNTVLGIWRLLECPLALFLQIVALALVTHSLPTSNRLGRWRTSILGVTLGLALLARMDLIFFVLTLLLYQLLRNSSKSENTLSARFLRAVVPAFVASLLVLPYLVWNWRTFHHLLPISGAIKSTFPHAQAWHLPPSFAWPVVVAGLMNGTLLLKRYRDAFDTLCLLTTAATVLHLGYTMTFGALAPWYLTTGYLSVALCVMWTFTALAKVVPLAAALELPTAVLLSLLFFFFGMVRSTSNLSYTRLMTGNVSLSKGYQEPKRAFALKLRNTLPSKSRLFIFDAPGGVAYFSDLHLLPVDGLVADYAYDRELLELGPRGYAAKYKIDYFVAPLVRGGQVYERLDLNATRTAAGELVELQAPLSHVAAGRMTLPDADLLFSFREINPDLEKSFPQIGVWRLNSAGGAGAFAYARQ